MTELQTIRSDVPAMSTIDALARLAKIFSASSLVPAHYRNKMEDCFLALQMAYRLRVDPFMMMQKTYVVGGKPAMEAALMIALANASGLFDGPLQYEMSGSGESRECHAYTAIKGKSLKGPVVSYAMAKAEGWTKNAKWQSMTDLMLRYRAAAFFVRTTCPEVMLGMLTVEEAKDIIDITPDLRVQDAPKHDSSESKPQPRASGAPEQNAQQDSQAEASDDGSGSLFPPELSGDLDAKLDQHDVLRAAYEQFSIAFSALPMDPAGLDAIYQKCRVQWGVMANKDGCIADLTAIKDLFWTAAAEAGYPQPSGK